jgi:hypothetical protein
MDIALRVRNECVHTDYHLVIRNPVVRGFLGFKGLSLGVPNNLIQDTKYPGFFQVIKTTFLIIRTNILISALWEKTYIGVGQALSSHRKEWKR